MTTLAALIQALAFLGTIALTLGVLAVALVAAMRGSRTWARRGVAAALGVPLAYAAVLLAVGLLSDDRAIPPGATKAFCEFDCHVVYDIDAASVAPDGMVKVTVREPFDPASISPRRGDAPLTPGGRRFALIDDAGRAWAPAARHDLDATPLFGPLRPGESQRAELTFRLPAAVRPRGLLVEPDDPVSPFLIGHERSPFHGKTLLTLPVG
ncbi:MAG: hypothetical protein OEW77_04215 [Gemmatimonadota bacterium]|nr:hypothetical protein [Gemmatimonadota bacterium]